MTVKARLEIYPSTETKQCAVIVGEKTALRELARAILRAADTPLGFETTRLFKSSGHDYEIIVTQNVTETEWQSLPSDPNQLEFVENYNSVKSSIIKPQQ